MVGAASNSVVLRGRKAGLEDSGANPETAEMMINAKNTNSLVMLNESVVVIKELARRARSPILIPRHDNSPTVWHAHPAVISCHRRHPHQFLVRVLDCTCTTSKFCDDVDKGFTHTSQLHNIII